MISRRSRASVAVELGSPGVRRHVRGITALRVAVVIAVAVAAALLVVCERLVRWGEALVAAQVNRMLLTEHVTMATSDGDPAFTFGSPQIGYSLSFTVECSIAFYGAALSVIGGALLLIRRLSVLRVLLSSLGAIALMIMLNQLRMVLLEAALLHGGKPAFEWAHSLVGSVLMLFGLAVCLFVFVRMVAAGSRSPQEMAS